MEASLVAPVVDGLAVELMNTGAVILELEEIGAVARIVVPLSFNLATANEPLPLFFCKSPLTPAGFPPPPPPPLAGKV